MPKDNKTGKLILPAVKGRMGDRNYFVTVMLIKDIVERVKLAGEMNSQAEKPSVKLQRDIKDTRLPAISDYLLRQEERFFNSLVVGIHGDPGWRCFNNFSPKNLSNYKEFLGFLEFSGKEKMYALDGQHRLRGMMDAIKNAQKDMFWDTTLSGDQESVGVVFVAHHGTPPEMLQRSRRLFTALNKHAQRVSKRDTIYLDEDDAVAIVTRKLIELKKSIFAIDIRVHTVTENALPDKNNTCFTSVGALYDSLNTIFKNAFLDKNSLSLPGGGRISDDKIEYLLGNTEEFFDMIKNHIPAMEEYYSVTNINKISQICRKYRNKNEGGHLLFRPMGLKIFIEIVCDLYNTSAIKGSYNKNRMNNAIKLAARLPLFLNQEPAINVVWDISQEIIVPKNFIVLKYVYQHMLGMKVKSGDLLKKYRDVLGDDKAKLPSPLKQGRRK